MQFWFLISHFQTHDKDWYLEYFPWNWILQDWWLVNIGLGNDLVTLDNKLLTELMFTEVYDAIWVKWQISLNKLPAFYYTGAILPIKILPIQK